MKFLLKDLRVALVGFIVGIGVVAMSNAYGSAELVIILSVLTGLYLIAVLVYQISVGFPMLRFKKPSPPTIADNNAIKSLLEDTHSLYNNTGLFIQSCYTDSVKTSNGKRMDLDKEFKNYLKIFKGRMLDFPQELEVKINSFFNILLEYIRRGEIITNTPKTQERYSQQQKLLQDFSSDAPVLYSEIDVELRKLLNKNKNPT